MNVFLNDAAYFINAGIFSHFIFLYSILETKRDHILKLATEYFLAHANLHFLYKKSNNISNE